MNAPSITRSILSIARMFCVATLASLCWPSAACGTIVYDTFGPGDSYDQDFKYSGGEFHFLVSKSGTLESITVALGRTSTEVTQTSFALSEEVSPNVFSLIESWVIPNSTPALPSPGAIVSFDSVVQPTLQVGHSYWMSMGGFPSSSLWFMNDQGIGQDVFPFTTTMPAFRVEIVPEPSTAALLLVACCVCGRRFVASALRRPRLRSNTALKRDASYA